MKKAIVSVSILGATEQNAEKEINKIKNAGIQWIHFDVMDGKFVSHTSFDTAFLKSLCDKVDLIKDVHIMIEEPINRVEEYAKCGADCLTFHYEACKDDKEVEEVINKIHHLGMKAGISIKPKTPVEVIYPFLKNLDLVLIMSVEPGLGGQRFIDASLEKIKALKTEIVKQNVNTLISVDGGINDRTAPLCINNGVDVLVIGQYLFAHDDFLERYHKIV
ncbi:MAG: ribulose-phosphate 3-epimerase [Bacilli bacterium]|nr:ribulose-phosphate 3-epimerase [Bacilli bacterium]